MPILLHWLLPIQRHKHGSLECSKVDLYRLLHVHLSHTHVKIIELELNGHILLRSTKMYTWKLYNVTNFLIYGTKVLSIN